VASGSAFVLNGCGVTEGVRGRGSAVRSQLAGGRGRKGANVQKWEGLQTSVGSEQRSDVGSEAKAGGLFQWLYGLKGHLLAASLPRVAQFADMKGAPFLGG
jgi:hypothetical protein